MAEHKAGRRNKECFMETSVACSHPPGVNGDEGKHWPGLCSMVVGSLQPGPRAAQPCAVAVLQDMDWVFGLGPVGWS